MRLFVLTLAVLLAVSCRASESGSSEEATYAGGQLVGMLEKFKSILQNGNAKLGIPVLDPFSKQEMNIYLQAQKLFFVNGTLNNVREAGLSNYNVDKGDFSLAGLKASVGLNWKQISVKTLYEVAGTLTDSISFWGKGDLSAVVQGLKVTADLQLGVSNGKLNVKNLQLHLHITGLPCKITGLFGDEETSNIVSQIITETAPGIIEDYQQQISKYASEKGTELLNNILKNFTLKDLMDIINGK